jgi:hypothetical protein
MSLNGLYGGQVTIQTQGNTIADKTVLDVQGTQGQLFSVTDDLSGDIFSVADISGVPILNVNSDGTSYFDGNVGIGTDSPGAKLEVNTSVETDGIRLIGSSTNTRLTIENSGAPSGNRVMSITSNSGVPGLIVQRLNNDYTFSSNLLRITPDGNVGIGTTTPSAKLNIGSAYNDAFVLTDGRTAANTSTFDSSIVWDAFYSDAAKITLTHNDFNTTYRRLHFDIGGNELMSIKSNGNVGIGTVSPGAKLEVEGDATSDDTPQLIVASGGADNNAIIHLTDDAGGQVNAIGALEGNILTFASVNELVFKTDTGSILGNTNTRMTIDTNGDVGIGVTNPILKLHIEGTNSLPATSGTAQNGGIRIENGVNNGVLDIGASNATGAPGWIQATDKADLSQAYKLLLNPNGGEVGIGVTNPSVRLHVNQGNVTGTVIKASGIGAQIEIQSSTAGDAHLYMRPNTSSNKAAVFKMTAGTNYNWRWQDDATTPVVFMQLSQSNSSLSVKGDIIAYGAPSDKRYKENIKPIESALDKAVKLQGVTFDWKESDSILDIKEDIGFIAQDVQKVVPELVRENEDGKLSLRYQGVTPILLEAIKELKAEIDLLKSKPCNCNNCNCSI